MTSNSRWDERIARATLLAVRHPATADLLTFYASLAGYQRSLAERWSPIAEHSRADSLVTSLDRTLVLDAVEETLAWLEREAPPGLVDVISGLHQLRSSDWQVQLERYLAGGSDIDIEDVPRVFVIETLLQPLAELMAAGRETPPYAAGLMAAGREAPPYAAGHERPPYDDTVGRGFTPRHDTRCPFCDQLPVVGVLREEGHGAKRTLVCGLCASEWNYLRIVCPSCGERTFDRLPVYTAEQFDAARVEGCDSCRTYLKTIDATRDGLAVPLVDDLATVTLDLWAREQGYTRLRGSLLRT